MWHCEQTFLRHATIAVILATSLSIAAVAQDAESIDQLLVALDSENQLERQRSLIQLEKRNAKAALAIDRLCELLSSESFSERSLASQALSTIGKSSIEPLRKLIKHDSSVARAAALQTLAGMDALAVDDIMPLVEDSDPRVRASVAISLGKINKSESIEVLKQLLDDNEVAVVAQAILSLKGKTEFSETIVPALAEATSRPQVGKLTGECLASFGTDARSAIPALIENSKNREFGFRWNLTEDILSHIGPPDPADIIRIAGLLNHKDAETTILAATAISHLGAEGIGASEKLEETIGNLLRRCQEVSAAEAETEDGVLEKGDSSGQISVAADACVAAYWSVTSDHKKFIELIEKSARLSDSAVVFHGSSQWDIFQPASPWTTFPSEQIRLIETLLRSENANVVKSGLHAASQLGPRAKILAIAVAEVGKRDLKFKWIKPGEVLAGLGPANESASLLLADYRAEKIDLKEFAKAIDDLGTGSEEVEQLLLSKLGRGSGWDVAYCAQALCRVSKAPEKATAAVISSNISKRQKIQALAKISSQSDTNIDFYISCVSDSDAWTRHAAIAELGKLGPRSASAKTELLRCLEKEKHQETKSIAEATLYLITGELPWVERFLDEESKSGRDLSLHRWNVLKTIGTLNTAEDKFLHYLTQNESWFVANDLLDFCETLGEMKTERSRHLLLKLCDSKDWKVKSLAMRALKANNTGDARKLK